MGGTGDTIARIVDYQANPTPRKLDRLVRLNIALVQTIANRYKYRCPDAIDDLIQEGCVGLVKAIKQFDVSRNYAFSTFAAPKISSEIRHYLRDKATIIRVPRAWDARRKVFIQLHELGATSEAIAEATGIPEHEQRRAYYALKNTGCRLMEPVFFTEFIEDPAC